ncbi:MAG: DUF262 domain-containing protein [Rhodobacteraceae bacterium]|nr:DUF262 domain-containing protein [Paracoccaceae bacterium]
MKSSSIKYDFRVLEDWLKLSQDGSVILPDFQRSFVWTMDKVKNYIQAIINDKPVGFFLILEKDRDKQFEPRDFYNLDFRNSTGDFSEFILDGQQRMTSLLQCIHGKAKSRLFVKFEDLSSSELEFSLLEAYGKETRKEKEYRDVSNSYDANLVPLDILLKVHDDKAFSPLTNWCQEIFKSNSQEARLLEIKIDAFFKENFFKRQLWACFLPSSTDRPTATDIFVETNTSSVKIKRFDIEVARVESQHSENLRTSINEECGKEGKNFGYYFKNDPEDWIPDIGEWMLKVACLKSDLAPKEVNYKKALDLLYQQEMNKSNTIKKLLMHLSWSLEKASAFGAFTDRILPSWPPLHVIAALYEIYNEITNPSKINSARELLSTYYWRCIFSDRYDAQANDRLFFDFVALKREFQMIKIDGTWCSKNIPALNETDYPLCSHKSLLKHTPWIGKKTRLGRAVASLVMSNNPSDWITGDPINENMFRDLEANRNLDTHHVFPKKLLEEANIDIDAINSGLNGVFLNGRTNKGMSNLLPEIFIQNSEKKFLIKTTILQKRIEEHLVPFETMNSKGELKVLYDKFLNERAKIIAEKVASLGEVKK